MTLRKSSLTTGWYPQNPEEIIRFLTISPDTGPVRAVIAPHAGWFYSGKIAARAIACLDRKIETLVIIGGHLPAGQKPLFAMEDAVQTPLGRMTLDTELRAAMLTEIDGREDSLPDNTVEVLLPMARFFFPEASLLWMRLPDNVSSFEAGKKLAAIAGKQGRKLAVIASADLTHYGPNYDFTPVGTGPEALRWVEDVNDRRFIDAVESGNPAEVLERAKTENSSCSAGAVLGAMGFAQAAGIGPARLLEYGTSADAEKALPRASFVSYASFTF
ncbi:MAG: AmmeMemoRadiSam system protein B [Treponema sp.]|nr:AmmeMemoRadiSam system protein B [Treponema sp.]